MRPRYSDIQISLRPGEEKPDKKDAVTIGEAIRTLASSGKPFTADDVLDLAPHPDKSHSPNARNSAIGSAFQQVSREGLIEAIGVTRSQQPWRKGGMVRIWQGKQKRRLKRIGETNGN